MTKNNCKFCGEPIVILDRGMNNYLPYNLGKPHSGIHICVQNPYGKVVRGRKDYICWNCKKVIPKGTKHYAISSRVNGTDRIHLTC